MAGHPYLNLVKDPAAMAAIRQLQDDIAELRSQLTTLRTAALQSTTTITAGGQRIANVADPTDAGDAVNLRTVRRLVNQTVGSF